MIAFCPRCGAELPTDFRGEWFETSVRCSDCAVAVTEAPPALAPSEDEVSYVLNEWAVRDRGVLTSALVEVDIPYRWGAELVLTVPAGNEVDVDRLLDDLTGEPAQSEAGSLAAEADDADGGEEAKEAMDDLFVAADRLQHSPHDEGTAAELMEAAASAGASLPPYGIEEAVWGRIQDLATAVVTGLEADGDEVAAHARRLRDFLRSYV